MNRLTRQNWNKVTISLVCTITSIGLISACSSVYQNPESFEDKMSRFEARNLGLNTPVKLKAAQVPLTKNNTSRGPASVDEKSQEELHQVSKYRNLSNRQMYFTGLYSQYLEFSQYQEVDKRKEVSHCPAFHTQFVDQKQDIKNWPKLTYAPSGQLNANRLTHTDTPALFPELMLPLERGQNSQTVYEAMKSNQDKYKVSPQHFEADLQQLMTKALVTHSQKIYHELLELCEYGQSDNYYVYENLVNHTKRMASFEASSSNVQILLKTTLFSNLTLLQSLYQQSEQERIASPSRSIASVENRPYRDNEDVTTEVLKRINSSWSQQYVESLTRYR